MRQLQQLLRIYWSGEATETVRQHLLDLLNERNDEINAGLELKFENEEGDEEVLLDENVSQDILKSIHEKLKMRDSSNGSPAKLLRFTAKSIGWAAAVIICICSAVALFQYPPSKKGQTSKSILLEKHTALKIIENKNSQPLTIVLSDSSSVVLFQGSSLSFKESFDLTYRSLNLSGEARFKVARDTARPFTVYANGVATTALGTDFTVNTLLGFNKVRVRLSEGEVVIRSFVKNVKRKDIYLKPGQECTVDILSKETLIRNYKINKAYRGIRKNEFSNKNNTSLEFNKESLTSIFEKLNKRFNTEIRCNKRELRNLSFTGSFNPTDSLPMILTVVCSTNDLFFERNGAVITVRKQ